MIINKIHYQYAVYHYSSVHFDDVMDKRPSPQKQNSPYNALLQILKYNSFRIFITRERFQFSEILILYHIKCTKKIVRFANKITRAEKNTDNY